MYFFIVWGRKVRSTLIGHTIWKCPACGRLAPATIRDRESAFHVYFIPFGYRYDGRFGECHWCESQLLVEPDKYPTVEDGRWSPGAEGEGLAAALHLNVDGRAFKAPPTAPALLVLWTNLRWRIQRVCGESIGRFSLSSGLVAAAAHALLFAVLAIVLGPEGKLAENLLVGLVGGAVFGFAMGFVLGAPVRAMFSHWGYADRKLRAVLGEGVRLEPLKKILEQARRVVQPRGSKPGETILSEADMAKVEDLLEQLRLELEHSGVGAPPPAAGAAELPYERSPAAAPAELGPAPEPVAGPAPARSRGPAFRFNVQAVEALAGPEGLHLLRGRVKSGEVRPDDRLLLAAAGDSPATVIKVGAADGGPAQARLGPQVSLLVRGLTPGALRVGDVLLGAPRPEPDPPPRSAAPAAGDLSLGCPHCRKTLKVKPTLVGKTVRCPACNQPFAIGAP